MDTLSSWRCYLRTRKFRINPLLDRNQLIFDVIHPGKRSISKKEVQEQIAWTYFADPNLIVVFGLRLTFGGRGSSGFALIYHNNNNLRALQSFEPRHRQKIPHATSTPRSRRKMIKNERKRKKKARDIRAWRRRVRSSRINYYNLRGSW